jgi:hypothetical protein
LDHIKPMYTQGNNLLTLVPVSIIWKMNEPMRSWSSVKLQNTLIAIYNLFSLINKIEKYWLLYIFLKHVKCSTKTKEECLNGYKIKEFD